ncbi:GNAT family N-acetyltransferase [Salinibacillus xinjiangensis]|uniref:GNAT family N-acetyltransferase n=1 Tax=Salinibacillus xinjiangensis TaxID=1229268 RepID=A0A6G1X522_9BACI|nr:GNAT family N-acetyltransferase [Salinibacillus xinjiangensis]MRG86005.1 GNAT family N-acetyltransferase [Salinibacillus xinjiangensis]
MVSLNQIQLKFVEQSDRLQYFDYLLLADESELVVNKYINHGDMYSVYYKQEIVGAVLFTYHSQQVVELKNIALDPKYRGRGLGKVIINEAFKIYKRKGISKVIVGTANSSIGNLAFYQKVGFRMVEIKKDFFKGYPEPIFENGIRALDMVMFEKIIIE